MIYSQRLGLSITNEHFFYYILCDAFMSSLPEVTEIYQKYVNLILHEELYGSQSLDSSSN